MDIIAHRGYNGVYFENSIMGILYSLKQKYINGIELDVRLTKDKNFVVIHDEFLMHVSNSTNLVSLTNLNKLKQIELGNNNYTFIISTLEEILKSIKSSKKILLEIKFEFNKESIKQLSKILNLYSNLNIYVFSLNKEIIDYLSKINSNIKTGLLIGPLMTIDYNYDFLVVHHSLYKKKINQEVFFWTVNSLKKFKQIKNAYPKGSIISDKGYLLNQDL